MTFDKAYNGYSGSKMVIGNNANAYSDVNGTRYFYNIDDWRRVRDNSNLVSGNKLDEYSSRLKSGGSLNTDEWLYYLLFDPSNHSQTDGGAVAYMLNS